MEDKGQIDAVRKKIPVVFVDRNPNRKGAVVVESDNYTGGFIATEELIKAGSRKNCNIETCFDKFNNCRQI